MLLPATMNPASRRDAAILIVDDAPDNLGMLRKLMAQQGYQTFVANSGERALSIARRVRPDGGESENLALYAPPLEAGLVRPPMLQGRWLRPGERGALLGPADEGCQRRRK